MERFWSKVKKTESCWLWTAAQYDNGDAMFRFEGKTKRARRVAWYLAGLSWPVPKGYAVTSACRNKLCVRPDHLTLIPTNEVMRTTAAETRFWLKVEKTDNCWLWTAAQNHKGYGDFYVNRGFHTMAHRYSWILHFGPIPDGLFVCHRCDTPLCVKPDHLFVDTTQGNTEDMIRKGRHRFGVSGAKLTKEAVLAIRGRHANGETQRALAKEYGVSQTTTRHILIRRTWKHV